MHAVLIRTGPEILCAWLRSARFIGSGGRNDHDRNRSPRYHDHENQVGLGPFRSRSLDATRISSERQLPSYASHELREIPVSPPDSPADNLVSQGFLMPSDRIAEAKTFVSRTLPFPVSSPSPCVSADFPAIRFRDCHHGNQTTEKPWNKGVFNSGRCRSCWSNKQTVGQSRIVDTTIRDSRPGAISRPVPSGGRKGPAC